MSGDAVNVWVHNVVVHGLGYLLLGWCEPLRRLWEQLHEAHGAYIWPKIDQNDGGR